VARKTPDIVPRPPIRTFWGVPVRIRHWLEGQLSDSLNFLRTNWIFGMRGAYNHRLGVCSSHAYTNGVQ